MNWLDRTLATPAENLACDEALLENAETYGGGGVLRFWESEVHFVVLGYAGRVRQEVDVDACERAHIPILRRCSGGGTVLQGPGCLNYALVLPITDSGPSATITGTNEYVMTRHGRVFASLLGAAVRVEGHTDLAVAGLKFSGNAQRRRKQWLLFHGTFVLGLDLALMETVLLPPQRQPAYRKQRRHADFLMPLPVGRDAIKSALIQAWDAQGAPAECPSAAIQRLVAGKYSRPEWNLRW